MMVVMRGMTAVRMVRPVVDGVALDVDHVPQTGLGELMRIRFRIRTCALAGRQVGRVATWACCRRRERSCKRRPDLFSSAKRAWPFTRSSPFLPSLPFLVG